MVRSNNNRIRRRQVPIFQFTRSFIMYTLFFSKRYQNEMSPVNGMCDLWREAQTKTHQKLKTPTTGLTEKV